MIISTSFFWSEIILKMAEHNITDWDFVDVDLKEAFGKVDLTFNQLEDEVLFALKFAGR